MNLNNDTVSSVLVCVTDQHRCQRLIQQGKIIADAFKIPMHVASVQDKSNGSGYNNNAMEFLFRESIACNADMSVYFSSDVSSVLIQIAKRNHTAHIVLGASPSQPEGPLIHELRQQLPEVFFHIVNDELVHPVEDPLNDTYVSALALTSL